MKKIKSIFKIAGTFALLAAMIACEPQLADKPDIGLAPETDQLDFSIAPGQDEFHVVITNTSSVTGIAHWDFGNNVKLTGQENEVYYPIEGDYTITMTLVTRGGVATISKPYTQTATDFSIFTDPVYVNLSGGIDSIKGRTWVLDQASKGHIAVGPSNDPNQTTGTEWWQANPFEKNGTGLADDEINFKLNEFIATYDNKGVSYVKGYRANDPALASVYLNARVNNGDYDVDYTTPVSGGWTILEKSDGYYLILSGEKPIFPCFDVGAKNNEYKIVALTENTMELTCYCAYEDWTKWRYLLIRKGYVRPTITYTVNVVEGTDNDVAFSVTDFSIPADQSVTNITWNFGDGSDEVTTTTKDEVIHHTYMRHGTYSVVAKLNTSLGVLTATNSLTLVNDNSAYVPFLLDMMIMYNDFSEVQVFPVLGQDCSVTFVDNPAKVYPNKSSKVAFYSKNNNEWANAYMLLNPGYRFTLSSQHIFKVMVYGKAGDEILLKLENTDRGGDAWKTGTADLKYVIKKDNTWEVAEYNFSGVAAGYDGSGDIFTSDITTDPRFNQNFYNVVRIMCNPGNGTGVHEFYFDELAGPHVEGISK